MCACFFISIPCPQASLTPGPRLLVGVHGDRLSLSVMHTEVVVTLVSFQFLQ